MRLRVHDSGLLFISSHLSSGEHEGDELKRNYDYSEIIRRGYFADEFSALDPSVLGAHQQHAGVSKVCSLITGSFPVLGLTLMQLPAAVSQSLRLCLSLEMHRKCKVL